MSVDDDTHKSRFTFRDLRHLAQSSTTCPLRVIALVDFDCFYAQCEAVRLGLPDTQPLGVQQFNHVIAINYPARAAGLKKITRAEEVRERCPNIVLQHVPTWREGDTTWRYRDDAIEHMATDKSSLDYYRLQSRRALAVVKETLTEGPIAKVEKASIDEIFVDLSTKVHQLLIERYPELTAQEGGSLDEHLPQPHTEILDWQDAKLIPSESDAEQQAPDWADIALKIGSEIVQNLRTEIHEQLQYTCSAGISHNKVIAKLAAGHNKPNKQTIVRSRDIGTFLSSYKFTKMRGFGGKLGAQIKKTFNVEMIPDLLDISLGKMQSTLGSETGLWVHRAIRGIEHAEVTPRTEIQSMLSAKTFTPSITGLEQAEKWLRIFAADIVGRMDDLKEDGSNRRPKTMAVHHQINGRFGPTRSKQATIPLGSAIDADHLFAISRSLLVDISREGPAWPCLTMSVSVGDFSADEGANHSISTFFSPGDRSSRMSQQTRSVGQPVSDSIEKRPKKRTLADFQGFASVTETPQHSKNDSRSLKTPLSKQSDAAKPVPTAYRCPRCDEMIGSDTVLEHLDWHTAVDLQNEGSFGP